jgi:DNA polymerase
VLTERGPLLVHNCGYGGGVNALEKMARQNGLDFSAAGVDPQAVVDAWRTLHAPIKRLWYALEDAFLAAVRGEESQVTWSAGAFTFTPSENGRDVAVFLPSGRPVVYNEVRESPGKYTRPALSYQGTKFREHLYGGKLCENVIQAFCRDLMADALVRAEDAGLEPVLHVHDEIVCARGGLEDIRAIMLDLPEWAAGFPIGAAGHAGARYRK